jgi:uncharacterized membrane protein
MIGGAFLGMLIRIFFWRPWLGMTIDIITGTITGK